MVCGACLRSVEVSAGTSGEATQVCPYCGQDIDSRQGNTRIQEGVTQAREEKLFADSGTSDSSLGWTETWSRGSLGSLGRFQLRERLGDGGFGQVFLAFDPRLDRDIALKVLKQPNPTERVMERFFREARAAARLDHPNIVAVHDAGFADGRCWVAFHFVSGRPLNWYRDQHRLDPPTAARIMRDLADAVDHAHRQGVLHRDIKPANVLIDDLGRPRLIDFGLARRSDLDSSLTHDGAVVGTPAYMSPEQALGFSRRVDERSDVFSLGVIFFEILTGLRPYAAASKCGQSNEARENSAASGLREQSPSVRTTNPAVPAALDRICMRAIAQDPRNRYASARSLSDDLDKWLHRHRKDDLPLAFSSSYIISKKGVVLPFVIGAVVALALWAAGTRSFSGAGKQANVSPAVQPAQAIDQPQDSLAVPGGLQLIGNPSKGRYHVSTCPDVRSMSPSNKVELRGPDEARAMGLQPCAHCHPDASGALLKPNAAR
jgi:serine/threonine protein kinase